jgi:hypothetical protein
MTEIFWDPLENKKYDDQDLISAAKKRQIKNILKSYVSAYDSFSELIQNAMDAVDIRATSLNESGYQKEIKIVINLEKNEFTISDNGIGFKEAEFKIFLAPDRSFKNETETRGHKGVGSTYIAFGFNYLLLGTKSPEFSTLAEIINGRNWVEDSKGIVTKPVVKTIQTANDSYDNLDRGATFTIKYGGDYTRPKNLSYFGAETADQWLHILLVKTPLGNVDFFNLNSLKTFFSLKVIDSKGLETEINNHKADYAYPHNLINASANLKDILTFQQKLIAEGKPVVLPSKFSRLNGIYEYFSKDDLKQFKSKRLSDEMKNLIDQYQITAYGYFCYSTDVWDELNDNVIKLRKGTRLLRGGLQLANNYMIQGDLIAIPLTSNIGYQNQTHVVVHFRNADPDLGRKGFQPELKELGEILGVAIVNKFKTWRQLLKVDTGAKPNIASSDDVFNWITEQADYERSHPLVITNKNFFAPVNEISITSIPQSEQDVIVLFNQLLAGGVIRGLKLLATDQKRQYDGVFKYFVREPISNHIYDEILNPLGVSEMEHRSDYSSRPYILEYKFSVDGLLREFENGEKLEHEINLVIAWETGEIWKKTHQVTSLLDVENLHNREFHGLTHIFHSGKHKLYAIILSELVDYLNDFDNAQKQQKLKYDGEDT